MKVYQAGRESTLLADIRSGKKNVEIRLNRDKFAQYSPGDLVKIREDVYQEGTVVASYPDQLTVRIEKVDDYPSFKEALDAVDFKNVFPRAGSLKDALEACYRFYTPEDETKFGVLTIYITLV